MACNSIYKPSDIILPARPIRLDHHLKPTNITHATPKGLNKPYSHSSTPPYLNKKRTHLKKKDKNGPNEQEATHKSSELAKVPTSNTSLITRPNRDQCTSFSVNTTSVQTTTPVQTNIATSIISSTLITSNDLSSAPSTSSTIPSNCVLLLASADTLVNNDQPQTMTITHTHTPTPFITAPDASFFMDSPQSSPNKRSTTKRQERG